MGCLKLHDGFSSELRLILFKKPQKGEKKTGCCYPFGLEQQKPNTTIGSTNLGQKFKYNGKELNEELGLDWYDFGARNYSPELGRWMNVDPLAEDYYNISSYAYVANNPLTFVDPDGMRIDIWI